MQIVGIEKTIPAMLSEALCRHHLVYPLASFDVSGQWLMYFANAWPNEEFQVAGRLYTRTRQAVKKINAAIFSEEDSANPC